MFWLLCLALVIWGITRFYLRGEDLSPYDLPLPPSMSGDAPPSQALLAAEQQFQELFGSDTKDSSSVASGNMFGKAVLGRVRSMMDAMGDEVPFSGKIVPVEANGLRGEWLIPVGADMGRRMLYIHGGAFIVGSPRSHRAITTRYANMIGGPVFSLDYRLGPENRRQAGIDDCRNAYQWLLANSPEGKAPAHTVFISGDSAGGNLTLSLNNWIRDNGLQSPDAVVALSPLTDATLASPSLRSNVASDKMLGPALGKLAKVPGWILLWTGWFNARIAPSNASVSPALAELGGLPPTLVHASESEMLFDDAVRYVNKARSSGSPVSLQSWNHVMHVWHMFHDTVPEADEAMKEIERFLSENSTIDGKAATA